MLSASASKSKFERQLRRIKLARKHPDSRLRAMMVLHGCRIGVAEARKLARVLRTNPFLRELLLGRTRLDDVGVAVLAEGGLRHNYSLKRLHLDENGIGDDGVRALAGALRGNCWSSLAHLNLDRNNIGVDGARALADVLPENSTLTELHLSSNCIGDDGASALADALRRNSSLAHLNLRNSGIGVEGARALADVLPENSTLTELHLSSNCIGDDGVSALADALRDNSSLTYLNLIRNGFGDDGASSLANVLRDHTSLTRIYLNGNDISVVGAMALVETLKFNASLTCCCVTGPSERIDNFDEGVLRELVRINQKAPSAHAALGRKVELLADSGHGSKETAVSLALSGINRFPESDQRREIVDSLLGLLRRVEDVERVKDLAAPSRLLTGRDLYGHVAECGAGVALANLLRAHPSLCECRDEEHGLFPFMLLATMSAAQVDDVFDVLLMKPELVESGIS